MTDLSARILARVSQLEAFARAAGGVDEHWTADGGTVHRGHPTDAVVDYTEAAEHIAGLDPAFVLNHLAPGARAAVELHGRGDLGYDADFCASCGDVPQVPYPCDTLQAAARMVGVDPT